MSEETVGRAVHPGRSGDHGGADDAILNAIRHARAASALAAQGDDALARGARRVAVWLALRSATRPPRTEQEHDAVLSGLEAFLRHLDEEHRVHVASLVEAAFSAQAERRVGMGLRPYGFVPSGRCGVGCRIPPSGGGPVSRPEGVMPDNPRRYEAASVADVSSSLSAAIDALSDVLALNELGSPAEGAWTAFEAAAIELCLDPAASFADRLDARRVVLIV